MVSRSVVEHDVLRNADLWCFPAIGTMSAKDTVHRDTRTRKRVVSPFGSSLRDFRSFRGLPSAIISVVEGESYLRLAIFLRADSF